MAAAEPIIEEGAPVVIRALLIPFAVLAGYFLAWGIAFSIDAFCRGLFGTVNGVVGWLPFANKVIETPLHAIEKKILSFLGGLEAHFEQQMATRFHQLAQVLERWAADAEAVGVMEWHLARSIYRLWVNLKTGVYFRNIATWIKSEIAHLHGVQTVVIHKTTVIEKTIVGKTKAAAHVANTAIAGELEHVIEWDIPRLRARTKALENEWARAWRWIRAHPLAIPEAVATALVAAALARLGGSWIRCRNWNKIGRSVCGLPFKLIEEILATAIDVLLIADVCQITKLMIRTAESTVVQDALRGIITGVDALMLCQGVDLPAPLGGYEAALPPAQAFSALPAA